MLKVDINIVEVLYILLISMPSIAGIANIMLANNLCDMEDDIENRRFTLPIYIGKSNGLWLFRALYYIGYIALAVLLAARVAPLVSLLVFGTFVIVNKNIKLFYEKQTKEETFVVGVKNFVIMNAALLITMVLGVIIN